MSSAESVAEMWTHQVESCPEGAMSALYQVCPEKAGPNPRKNDRKVAHVRHCRNIWYRERQQELCQLDDDADQRICA